MVTMTRCGRAEPVENHRHPSAIPDWPAATSSPLLSIVDIIIIGTLARYVLGIPPGHCLPCCPTAMPVKAGKVRRPNELCRPSLATRRPPPVPRWVVSSGPESCSFRTRKLLILDQKVAHSGPESCSFWTKKLWVLDRNPPPTSHSTESYYFSSKTGHRSGQKSFSFLLFCHNPKDLHEGWGKKIRDADRSQEPGAKS